MPMTLDEFRATGRDMTNAAGEVTARTYVEVLFIEHWIDGRAGIAPPQGVPTWLLTTDGPEQETGELEALEPKLYAWAIANGYGDDEGDDFPPARTFRTEFPDYPGTDVPACLTASGWTDNSWHNDAAPFFVHEASGVGVWSDYLDPAARECGGDRFIATAMTWDAAGWQHDLSGGGVLFETEDAGVLAASLPNFTNVRAIAHAFALAMETDYADDIATIRERNASDDYAASVCASHDFCDANMIMVEAFETVMGRAPTMNEDTPESEAASQTDYKLMGEAWNIARAERLSAAPSPKAAAVAVGTVLDLFAATFPGVTLADDTLTAALRSMPVDSTCGDDCKAAILSAGLLAGAVIKAHGREYGAETITAIAGIAASSCGTYICG